MHASARSFVLVLPTSHSDRLLCSLLFPVDIISSSLPCLTGHRSPCFLERVWVLLSSSSSSFAMSRLGSTSRSSRLTCCKIVMQLLNNFRHMYEFLFTHSRTPDELGLGGGRAFVGTPRLLPYVRCRHFFADFRGRKVRAHQRVAHSSKVVLWSRSSSGQDTRGTFSPPGKNRKSEQEKFGPPPTSLQFRFRIPILANQEGWTQKSLAFRLCNGNGNTKKESKKAKNQVQEKSALKKKFKIYSFSKTKKIPRVSTKKKKSENKNRQCSNRYRCELWYKKEGKMFSIESILKSQISQR